MKYYGKWIVGIMLAVVLGTSGSVVAEVVLGTGDWSNSKLLNRDVTDPTDSMCIIDGVKKRSDTTYDADLWSQYYSMAKWTTIASGHSAPMVSRECAANMFDNAAGPNAYKWNDSGTASASNPSYITLMFPTAFTLTHFTLTSGNDSMTSRNPTTWELQGSNNGTSWTTIYGKTNEAFTVDANTTLLYSSFADANIDATILNESQKTQYTERMTTLGKTNATADFATPAAYSQYRLLISGTASHVNAQLGELELFGNVSQHRIPTGQGDFGMGVFSAVHLDASQASTLSTDTDGNVSSWSSSDGSGVVFSQTNSEVQPNVGTISINGNDFAAVDFSPNSSDSHKGDYLTANATVPNMTIFLLSKTDTYKSLGGIYGAHGIDTGIRMETISGKTLWQGTDSTGNSNDLGFGGTTLYNGGTTGIDLTSATTLTMVEISATTASSFIPDLGSYTGYGRFFDGQVAELVVFSKKLSSFEKKMVNTYFHQKYGLDIAADSRFGTTFNAGYTKEYFPILYSAADNYAVAEYGTGGFGISTYDEYIPVGYDLFPNATLADGTALFATSNTDERFGYTYDTSADGENLFFWDKAWNLQNVSTTEALASAQEIYLSFNYDDAKFDSIIDDGVLWALMFRETETDDYTRLTDFAEFQDSILTFNLGLDDLQSGFYTLAANTYPHLPEPASWVLLLLGVIALKQRLKNHSGSKRVW